MKYLLILLVSLVFSNTSFAADQVPFAGEINSSIKNYNRATPLLATSGALGDGAVAELAEKGITTIINLRTESEGAKEEGELAKKYGITYINIPVSGETITDEKILSELAVALDNIIAPTLLHCASGNRVGSLLTQYYISKGVAIDTAFEKGRTAGMKPTLEDIVREAVTSKTK